MNGPETTHIPGTPAECGHWDGTRQLTCRATDGVRLYGIGIRCPAHTPAAVAGRAEPEPGPGLPDCAWEQLAPISKEPTP